MGAVLYYRRIFWEEIEASGESSLYKAWRLGGGTPSAVAAIGIEPPRASGKSSIPTIHPWQVDGSASHIEGP